MWVTGLVSAISIKLTSSIDDVVWLAPFLTSNVGATTRMQNTVVYISVCLMQTVVAMLIAYSGNKTVKYLMHGNEDAWSSDKILTVGAGSLLAVYSIKLSIEYIQELREGAREENADPENRYDKVATTEEGGGATDGKLLSTGLTEIECADPPDGPNQALTEQEKKDQERQQTLFVIAFIGSIDDLTLFVPMLVGKAFDLAQLTLGAFISASAIVLLCLFIGLCKPIADVLSSIPLALIVVVFSTVLLYKGFTMD
mmetsp:Transcript_121704/g.344254  ORF Transcript_121704/g.344254 Transcript_121704/m.344254 type:complete len:255 (+) Transcript_121704:189-953(+)|eukprot:CAMPEP_0117509200 /NCGR_PEP_ID=MMETSP0784-20121206/27348_1 /TAXON_ID=39447 /ORGANISM="" /LENGTH=254 /DNA_ID=CAMNT_0005304791 /DNA_START=166 /DNA_END=930 /DNA_ORIENTATION=-